MKYTKGKWVSTFNLAKERGVRTESGFICFLPKPTHYNGQDERYEQELDECRVNAKLISKAPEMYEVLQHVINLKDIISCGENINPEHCGECEAIEKLLQIIESLLKEIES